MGFTVEIDREEDGRFIADVPAVPRQEVIRAVCLPTVAMTE
jgi:hypothetical protein